MASSNPAGPLVLTACLAGLGGFAASMLMPEPGPVSAAGPLDKAPGAAESSIDSGRSSLPANQALALEIAELKARLAEFGESAGRSVVATGDTPGTPEREGIERPDWSQENLALLDQLLAEFSSETFVEAKIRSVKDYELSDLVSNIVYEYTSAGMPFEALRIQRMLPGNAWDASTIAYLMQEAGHTGLASQLYLEALEQAPENSEWVRQLAELDPAGALALLEQANADGHMLATLEGRINLSRLMMATGDQQGALAMLNGGEHPLTEDAWNLLVEIDPKLAEAQMLAATKTENAYNEHSLRYARHLVANGRKTEALAALEAALLASPQNRQLLHEISNLSSERGLELWALQTELHPNNSENWSKLAAQLEGAGRESEALEAALQGFELSDSSYPPELAMRLAPDRTLGILQKRADSSKDDELWGDLGDTYWQAGNSALAKLSWAKAKEFDPTDGEWTGKLSKLAAGEDPVGDQGVLSGLGYFGDYEIVEGLMPFEQ